MLLPGIELKKLHGDELIQYILDFLAILLTNNPTALNVKIFYDAMAAEMAEVDKLYKIAQGSLLTPKIVEADGRRDRAFSGILAVVTGYTFHFDAAFAAAATLLQASINKYGTGIADQNLIAETTIITNLVGDWKNIPELDAAVDKLGLKEWLNELDAANKAFNLLYLERNKETAENPVESLDERRPKTYDIYYKLRDKVLANAEVNELANPWGVTYNQLKALIGSYNTLINRRGGSGDDEPTGGEGGTPPTP